jgi:hypothetical protein
LSILFLHCGVSPPVFPELPALLAELTEPIMIVLPVAMAEVQPEVFELFDHVIQVTNIKDNARIEWEVFRAHRAEPFTRILSTGELGILRAARLRAEFGLRGQSMASAVAYRDKVVMKDLIARAGIRVPRYRAVDAPSDLLGFVRDVGLPVVLKPRAGAGSVDTHLIRHDDELAACMAKLRANTGGLSMELIVEEFIRGQLHHINGYATADGRIALIWPSSYLERGALDIITEGAVHGEFLIEADDPRVPAMNAFAEACLRALPWPEHGFAFHLEAFETDDRHDLVFCEVASRHGGRSINELYRHGFGVSMAEASLRMQAGLPLPSHATRPRMLVGGVNAPVRNGRLSLASAGAPPFPWILSHDIKLKSGDHASGPRSCTDTSANFIVQGASAREVVDRMVQANQWFDQIASWEGPPDA